MSIHLKSSWCLVFDTVSRQCGVDPTLTSCDKLQISEDQMVGAQELSFVTIIHAESLI